MNVPGGVFGEEKSMERSAAARSATGSVNVTVTGIADADDLAGGRRNVRNGACIGTAATLVATAPGNSSRRHSRSPPARTAALYARFHPPMPEACRTC